MANYIDEEILCEAYTHLDIKIYNDKRALKDLEKILLSYFEERAKFLLGENIRVQIQFEEGSLKTKLQVLGSAGLVLINTVNPIKNPLVIPAAIIGYGDFRQGIEQISHDVGALAQGANLEVIFRTKTAYCDRVTIEKRKGVFGRVDELLTQLTTFKSIATEKEAPKNNTEIKEYIYLVEQLIIWNGKVEKLLDKTQSTLTEECVAGGLLEEIKTMPNELGWKKKLNAQNFQMKILKSDPLFYGEVEAIAAQYAATLKSIKAKLKSRRDVANKINNP